MIKQRHIAQITLGYSPCVLGFLDRMYGHGIRDGFHQAGTIPCDEDFEAVKEINQVGREESL